MILDYSFTVQLNFRNFRNFCNKCLAVFHQFLQIVFRKFRKYEIRKVSQIQACSFTVNFYVCFARFAMFLTQILSSTAEFSSLRDLHGAMFALTLNSGKPRSAALVACFAAGSALAVRRRRLPNKPQPCAFQRLPRGAQ